MRDALGRITTTNYDNLDRVVKHTDAKGAVTSFQYDGVSNLLSVTDARGGKTTFTYDLRVVRNEEIERDWSESEPGIGKRVPQGQRAQRDVPFNLL